MSNKRMKLKAPVIKSRAEMERLVGEITALKLHEIKTSAIMDQRLSEIRAEYELELSETAAILDLKLEAARVWAEANPDEFGKAKSIAMTHGTVGFRTGKPKLKILSRWTLPKVTEAMKALAKWNPYLRTKIEPNKELLLSHRERISSELREIGFQVVQDESFFFEPCVTEVTTKEVV